MSRLARICRPKIIIITSENIISIQQGTEVLKHSLSEVTLLSVTKAEIFKIFAAKKHTLIKKVFSRIWSLTRTAAETHVNMILESLNSDLDFRRELCVGVS